MTTPSWVAWAAAVAALASAAFSGCLYVNAEDGLRQQRQGLLMAQRVSACAELNRRAGAVWAAVDMAAFNLDTYGRHSEFFDQRGTALNELVGFNDAKVLVYLGPDALASAESDLSLVLTDAELSMEATNATPASIRATSARILNAKVRFQTACVNAVRAYRAD